MYDLRRNPLNYISILFRGFHINRFRGKAFQRICLASPTNFPDIFFTSFPREPIKIGLKRENGDSATNARKTDEVRLNALQGGLTTQAVCYTHFNSNKVFRGDRIIKR